MSILKRAVARIPLLGPSLQRAYWRRLERRAATRKQQPALSAVDLSKGEIDVAFLRGLGYDFDPPKPVVATPPAEPLPPPSFPDREVFFVTVCSMNHVPFARTLLEGVVRNHGAVPFAVAVVDAPSRDAVSIDGAIVLTGRDVFGAELDYAALKYDASQLCCAAKAYAIDYLLRHSQARKIVYLDSDIYVFAPLDAMLARLDGSDFVVTPHIVEPFEHPEKLWQRPSLGALMGAGVFNAGMFGMRRSASALQFLETLKRLVVAPGTFVDNQGGQAEQHMFNWITCFADSVSILRDTPYNVAYWNLHDRAFRYVGEQEGEGRWTVDQKPLVAFHFSGFSPARPFEFSHHQNRYSFYDFPALALVRDFYTRRVEDNNRGELGTAYRFGAFPSGVPIDGVMREIFRTEEVALRTAVSPWTAAGEAVYGRALLLPVPSTSSLLPILIKRVRQQRPDLSVYGDVTLNPRALIEWMLASGVHEHGYERLFDRYRPVVPTHYGAILLSAIGKKWPRLYEGLKAPMREDRPEFLARLQEVAPYDANQILIGATEQYVASPIRTIRELVEARADLRAAFPDLLFADGPAFAEWLRRSRMKEHFIPAEAIELFAERANGGPLARIYSFFSRAWPLMEQWPLALTGEETASFARALLDNLKHGAGYDLHDVEMFLWTMSVKPWAGVPLTLELPIHTTRHPSSRSRAGQHEILLPVLRRDAAFAVALDEYRRRYPPADDAAPRSLRTSRDVSVFSAIGKPPRRIHPAPRPLPPGVNVFGARGGDTVVGQLTRGLVQSLRAVDCETSMVPLTAGRMDRDVRPDDFIRRYDPAKGTNIFVSVPDLHELLLRATPDDVVERHRNIVYLAAEQRDGSHYWKDAFAEFDAVWAPSQFAADALAKALAREVHVVPCAVDVPSLPEPSQRGAQGEPFAFLAMDNPDLAAEAFRRAFGDDPRVRLIIRPPDADDLRGALSAADCFVSLHRGVAFGTACAEAMAYAKPVIATAYSGNLQFMTGENSYLVRCEEVEANVQEGPYQRGSLRAAPDVDHAAELMRRVYEQRDEAAERGARGRATVEMMLSPRAVGERIRVLLDGDR